MERCASLSLLLGWYYAVKIPQFATTANTIVLNATKEISDDHCFFGTCFYLFRVPNVQRMAEACSLCTCRSCAQLRQSPGFARFSLMRPVDALHLSHEHWATSICSKQLSGLEVMILVHQFSNAENKLVLWLWVSHSRGKWKQESERVFLC